MSDYEVLKRRAADQALLYESHVRQLDALRLEREATIQQMGEALAREKKEKEAEFIRGELVLISDTKILPEIKNHRQKIAAFDEAQDDNSFWARPLDAPRPIHANYCQRPKDEPSIFIRHAGNECPVSDRKARIAVLLESGNFGRGRASDFDWGGQGSGRIIGYVIIPKWALERVK